jgi:dihydrofolate reductase
MTKVRVAGFSISLDGFGAGPEQSLENPLGKRGLELHQWMFGTRMFQAMIGKDGGSDGVDEAYAYRSMDGFGAFILGRNMFGPIRGPWPDENWKGWWGDNPPYHAPTFVLTHYPRDPIEMEGGTTFIFDQRYRGGVGPGETSRQWSRREDRRWRRDGASISSRRIGR